MVNIGQHTEGEVGDITQKGGNLQRKDSCLTAEVDIVADFPEQLQHDYLNNKAVQPVMQTAAVKITQQQRIDGVKAEQRTEEGHVDGAAAGDNKISGLLKREAGVAEKPGTAQIQQRKQQVRRKHRQEHSAEEGPLIIIGMAIVADEHISRNKHYQGYGKEGDNIQQHFGNSDPRFRVGVAEVPGGVHQHDAQNHEAT